MPESGRSARGWLASGVFAIFLWLPVLALEMVVPAAFTEIVASPVLRRQLGLAAALWAATVLTASLAAVIARAFRRPASDGASGGPALGAGVPAALAASWWVVALQEAVQRAVLRSLDSPPLAAAALLASAVLFGVPVALGVAALARRFGRRSWQLAVTLGLALWLGAWWFQLSSVSHVLLPAVTAVPLALWVWAPPGSRRDRRALLGGALSLAALAVGVALLQPRPSVDGEATRSGRSRPNVVVLLVDTLRTDHTGLGGRAITPRLAGLAGAGSVTTFTTAMSPAASTVPSVKSLFTGRSPSAWGLATAGSAPPPADAWTLASAFRRAGYATGAFSANGLIQEDGFESGFERFWSAGGFNFYRGSYFLYRLLSSESYWWSMGRVESLGTHKIRGETIVRQGLAWIDRMAGGDRPFFAYLHIVEPHWPFHSHGYGLVPEELRSLDPVFSHVELLRLPKGDPRNAALRVTPQMREMVGRYEEEIHRSDVLLGEVLDRLDRAGVADDTLFVFLADHGEELFEHNGFGHGHDVFDEQVRVPLVIRWPAAWDLPGGTIEAPVSLTDVAPTLADLLALGRAPAGLEGASLRGLLEGSAEPRPVIAEGYAGKVCRAAYREGRYKVRLEFSAAVSPRETDRVLAFDLAADPGELRPFLGADLEAEPIAGVVARARAALEARWRAWPDRLAGEADAAEGEDEALEQLRSLGYVD